LSADYIEDEGALCWQKAYGQHPRQEIVIRYPADETWPVTIGDSSDASIADVARRGQSCSIS
jgi:hypothetical protein